MANLIIVKDPYTNKDALCNVVNYVVRPDKTKGVSGGQGVLMDDPYSYMEKVTVHYQNKGKQVQHFILSFEENEGVPYYAVFQIGYAVCAMFPEYQSVFGFHQDAEHQHIHWAINPVRVTDGKKLNFTYEETFGLRKKIAELLESYDIKCHLCL